MTNERLKTLTLKVIFGDMLLNWTLGAALTFLPGMIDSALGTGPVLPLIVWRVIGVGFLLFAAWQTWTTKQQDIGPLGLWFACWMAWIPVVLLAIALLYMTLPLWPLVRIALWVANIYMLLLGGWYAYLARRLVRVGTQMGGT